VEPVRSGDRPIGNPPSTDQSSAATEVTGNPEDSDAGRAAPAVPPTAEVAEDPAPGTASPGGEADAGGTAGPDGAASPGGEADAGGTAGPSGAANPDGAADAGGPGPGDDKAAPAPGEPGDGAGPDAPGQDGPGPRPGRPSARARLAGAGASGTADWAGTLRQARRWAERHPSYAAAGGKGFARITVMPAILVMAWLLVGLPLLLAGAFLPTPVLLIAVPVAIALAAGLRQVPAAWPRALRRPAPAESRAPRREPEWAAWWGLAGTVAVALGFTVWQFLFNSASIIVLRNPGAALQTGYWIAQHGSLPIPQSLAAFGGPHPALEFGSTGFFAQGTSVVPGLMSGLPLLLGGAFWVNGTSAAAAVAPILGGLAVLAFGGLVGRLAGPRWAPAGALVLGLTLPQLYTSRASFSETAAQVLLFGGLSLVVDALTLARARRDRAARLVLEEPATEVLDLPGWGRWSSPRAQRLARLRLTPPQVLMGLGGLALGLTGVVRFEGLLDVLPAIPFIGVLVVRRNRMALPLSTGLAIGAAYGLADAYLLARPFVDSLEPVPELIGLLAAWLIALTLAAVELLRLPGLRRRVRALLARPPARWLPDLGGALAVAVLVGFAIRPYLQTVRGPVNGAEAAYVAVLQRLEHLPVDPGRLYAEDTLYWIIWYIGLTTLLLGGFGLALLVRRCLRALFSWRDPSGVARIWALPLAVIGWGSAAVLWRPETFPDQPWASRRLVPLVLPGLILCAVWASAWLRGRARSRGAGRPAAALVAACCVVAMLVPTVATSFGLGLTHSGSNGELRLQANGLALKQTGQGQAAAVAGLCSALGPSATVVIVDRVVAARFTQVIRGMCGVPAAWIAGQPAANLQAVLSGIERAGRRPVLLGSRPSQLYAYGTPVRVMNLRTLQDPHTLTQPPTTPWPVHYVIWMTTPSPSAARV
jgi:hypothetical protein